MLNRIALSVDVEDWFHSRHVTSLGPDPNGDVLGFFADHDQGWDLLTGPVGHLLDLFRQRGLLATFFLVAGLAQRHEALFRRIAREGHEIACHDLHHVKYTGQGLAPERELFRANLAESRRILEGISDRPVLGYRAPVAVIRGWMVPLLCEMGFTYDSSVSVNSLYNKTDSSLAGVGTAPYRLGSRGLLPDPEGPLLELPWPYLNVFGFKLPTAGGPALRLAGLLPIRFGLGQSLARGDTVLYIHPLDISGEPLPEVIREAKKAFWRNRGLKTMRRFRRLLEIFDGRFCTCKDIAQAHF